MLAEKPHCLDFRVFEENLIGVEMRKLRHNINKPFQHGFCVLEWSKLKMYKFYALLKDAFHDKVRMLYTDTDSFFLQFFVEDLTQELKSRKVFGAFRLFRRVLSFILHFYTTIITPEKSDTSRTSAKAIPSSSSSHSVRRCTRSP